jgi:hypothetical protein
MKILQFLIYTIIFQVTFMSNPANNFQTYDIEILLVLLTRTGPAVSNETL